MPSERDRDPPQLKRLGEAQCGADGGLERARIGDAIVPDGHGMDDVRGGEVARRRSTTAHAGRDRALLDGRALDLSPARRLHGALRAAS